MLTIFPKLLITCSFSCLHVMWRNMNSYFFFFSSRRRHTRYWRDWSSDVCSSDLRVTPVRSADLPVRRKSGAEGARIGCCKGMGAHGRAELQSVGAGVVGPAGAPQPDRKSVGEGKSVDLGGRRIIKKKTSNTTCAC